jgi:hypothetical protein
MRSRLLPLLLALSVVPLTQILYPGCATMMSGARQTVQVRSKPEGATVFLNGKRVGVTPVTAMVSRWGWHRVRIEMAGYEPYEVKLEKTYNTNANGNLFIGGVWIVVDVLTGAIYQQSVPEKDRKAMTWDGPVRGFDFAPAVQISTTLKRMPSARQIGQMQRR